MKLFSLYNNLSFYKNNSNFKSTIIYRYNNNKLDSINYLYLYFNINKQKLIQFNKEEKVDFILYFINSKMITTKKEFDNWLFLNIGI